MSSSADLDLAFLCSNHLLDVSVKAGAADDLELIMSSPDGQVVQLCSHRVCSSEQFPKQYGTRGYGTWVAEIVILFD